MIRVGVLGALGKMGRTVSKAVATAGDLELVARIDRSRDAASEDLPEGWPPLSSAPESLLSAEAEVAVDFTVPDAAVANMEWCAANGLHGVCGTTGIDEAGLDRLRAAFGPADRPNAVLAPNFSISAAVMMILAEQAAPFFDGAEIVELHHAGKLDAPSGTSIETARRIDRARAAVGAAPLVPDSTTTSTLEGARGAAGAGGIRVHSVRLPGLVAHQEVHFGGPGETLTIRQDSYDRTSFMPGVLLAVRRVAQMPGLTLGLGELLTS